MPDRRTHALSRRRISALLLASALAGLAGCKKNAPTASANTEQPVIQVADGDYLGLYQARRYAEARSAAEAAIPKLKDRDREVATLTAGLSAHAQGDTFAAQKLLTPLTSSTDDQISGRAEAALGQIAQKQGKQGYAADLLARAAKKLDGDAGARAGLRAGNAYAATGQQAQAMTQYKAAASEASSDAVRKAANAMTEPGPFSLQAGVFSSQANANTRAAQLRSRAIASGLGPPRVVADVAKGKVVFAVHIGTFANRPAAIEARNKLGTQQVVVVNAN